MSQNIVIKKGNTSYNYNNVKKLKVKKDSGTQYWIPEADTVRGVLTATRNGTYKASQNNVYGFSSVIVNVTQATSVTGHGGDGNDHTISVDPVTGLIIDTVAPTSIQIDTLPSKLQYTDGETIDFTGLVVKAYDNDGNLWTDAEHPTGIIPISELTFPVTVAHSDGGVVVPGGSITVMDNDTYTFSGGIPLMDVASARFNAMWKNIPHEEETDQVHALYITSWNAPIYVTAAKDLADGKIRWVVCSEEAFSYTSFLNLPLDIVQENNANEYTMKVNGVYRHFYAIASMDTGLSNFKSGETVIPPQVVSDFYPIVTPFPTAPKMAAIILFGTTANTTQRIPVEWRRPGDYLLLDDYFEISVAYE